MYQALTYVINDTYFWPSMMWTTVIGVFIGAVLYDGLIEDVKKAVVAITMYASLLIMTNLARIIPIIFDGRVITTSQPLAGVATIFYITIFYMLGMYIGVKITNHAHGGKHSCRRITDKTLFV